MEEFQLFLTGVPFGVSALQSSWRGNDCNVSRAAFASESHVRGEDAFGNMILGVELNRVITEGKITRNTLLILSRIWAWRTIL